MVEQCTHCSLPASRPTPGDQPPRVTSEGGSLFNSAAERHAGRHLPTLLNACTRGMSQRPTHPMDGPPLSGSNSASAPLDGSVNDSRPSDLPCCRNQTLIRRKGPERKEAFLTSERAWSSAACEKSEDGSMHGDGWLVRCHGRGLAMFGVRGSALGGVKRWSPKVC